MLCSVCPGKIIIYGFFVFFVFDFYHLTPSMDKSKDRAENWVRIRKRKAPSWGIHQRTTTTTKAKRKEEEDERQRSNRQFISLESLFSSKVKILFFPQELLKSDKTFQLLNYKTIPPTQTTTTTVYCNQIELIFFIRSCPDQMINLEPPPLLLFPLAD